MVDRQALAAALAVLDDPEMTLNADEFGLVLLAAARERLAQLENGALVINLKNVRGVAEALIVLLKAFADD